MLGGAGALSGRVSLSAAVLFFAIGGEASAQESEDLARAKAQLESMALDEAMVSLKAALERGGSDRATLIEIVRLRGEAAAGMGDSEAAQEAFRRLLTLQPDFELDELASPKISAELDAAREALGGRSLELSHEGSGETGVLVLIIGDDPEAMVAGAEVSYRGAAAPVSVRRPSGASRLEVPVAAGARGVVLRALDRHGNRVRVFDVGALPEAASSDPENGGGLTRRAEPAPDKGIYQQWWLWAGAVGAFATSGVLFGLAADRAEEDLAEVLAASDQHYFSRAKELRDRGQRHALLANISYGAAAVAAGVGAYFVWQGFGAESGDRVKVSPAAGPEGAGVSMEICF